MEGRNFLLCVRSFTYNQAPYIVDALNGFCIQQTNFPFVCTIVDDASTDGEQAVILNYVQENFDLSDECVARNEETEDFKLLFAQHKTNRNCYFAVLLLKYNHTSIKKTKFPYISEWFDDAKYHCLCEGDDYWIEPAKLQMQVDFLEANPDYTMCFHNAYEVMDTQRDLDKLFSSIQDRDYSGVELFEEFIVPTASALYRGYISFSEKRRQAAANKQFVVGDLPIWLSCAHYGKVRGMSRAMSVYRRHTSSWTQDMSISKAIGLNNMLLAVCDVYGEQYYAVARDMYVKGTLYMMTFPLRKKGDWALKCRALLQLLKKYPFRALRTGFAMLGSRVRKRLTGSSHGS